MQSNGLAFIFLNAALMNNFVLAMFLGLCPFLGVSSKLETAVPMGIATTFVMMVSSVCAYGINYVLTMYNLEFLRLIAYIVVIASAVQLVEMTMKKYTPALFRALGIYLPLITTNCAVLGLALIQTFKGFNFLEALAYATGGGAGFTLAIALMAGLREKLSLNNVPSLAQGTVIALVTGSILSMAFMGFPGLGGSH
jgi:electron transport complex protein RnfA